MLIGGFKRTNYHYRPIILSLNFTIIQRSQLLLVLCQRIFNMNTSKIEDENNNITNNQIVNQNPLNISHILSNLRRVITEGYSICPSHSPFLDKIRDSISEYESALDISGKTVSFIVKNDTFSKNIATSTHNDEDNQLVSSPMIPLIEQGIDECSNGKSPIKADSSMMIDTISLTQSSPAKKAVSFTQTRYLHMVTQRPEINQPARNEKDEDKTKHVAPINLSKEQEIVAYLAQQGEHIFYTGSAGTGKSLLLKALIKKLKEQHKSEGHDSVAITASTGLAACNIGGMTINSFTGIGLGRESKEDLLRKVKRNRVAKNRWLGLKVLIIDEISMVDGHLLDKLEYIGRCIKANRKPFGGIQVILCGDFYQLPPVPDKMSSDDGRLFQKKIFAFESEFWKKHIKVQVELKKIFRQASDKQFMEMLTDIRNGTVSELTTKRFRNLERELKLDTIEPTRLFSTRKEVDYANTFRMKSLPGDLITFTADDSGVDANKEVGKRYLEQLLAPRTIQLKIGAQVMMIKNIDATLVNGSVGTVVGFVDSSTYKVMSDICNQVDAIEEREPDTTFKRINPVSNEILKNTVFDFVEKAKMKVKEEMDKFLTSATAKVAGACKVEAKSEDMPAPTHIPTEKEGKSKDLANIFSSTTESISEEYVPSEDISINVADGETNKILEELKERYETLNRKTELVSALQSSITSIRPVVQFKLASGDTRTVVVEREEFKWETENANNQHVVRVQRIQLPLMLAWALSIHKAQGQTLSYVSVDLKHIFEDGQAYVALSRAVHRKGLQVLNFTPNKVTTNKTVIEFYKQLKDSETVYTQLKSGTNYSHSSTWAGAPGISTQVRDLYEITASPERFAKRKSDVLMQKERKIQKPNTVQSVLVARKEKQPVFAKPGYNFSDFGNFSSEDDQIDVLANFEN